jgi:hypothetical protein
MHIRAAEPGAGARTRLKRRRAGGWFARYDQLALHLAVGYGLNEDKAARRPPPDLELRKTKSGRMACNA